MLKTTDPGEQEGPLLRAATGKGCASSNKNEVREGKKVASGKTVEK